MGRSVNCIIVDDEQMAREVLETHLQKIDTVNVIASCKNAAEAFNEISINKIDLIFLDINMPEISGLSFAHSINQSIKIIFTTAYREYAVDGFDLQAVDYLLKPISLNRLIQAINKYLDENIIAQQTDNVPFENEKSDFIFVRSNRKMVKINFSEIRYIESLSDYIKIHLENKSILTRETITNFEAKLPGNEFLRIHRSFIVAIAKINSFTNEYVEVNNKALTISRSYRKEVLKRLE
jgi:DNA-binding LytR/AlgR family response regulator